MAINQNDFLNWQRDEVTSRVMEAVQARVVQKMQTLLGYATDDLPSINWHRGYIQACQDLLEIDMEEVEHAD